MSARSLNKVQLIGNLTRDPELRFTPQGTAVCSFGLATNRSWTVETGDKKEETEFHRIVAWAKLAELCSQLLFKGRRIYVEGRLQTRQWTAQDGTPRSTTEIVIDDMIILDSKHESSGGGYINRGGNGNTNPNRRPPVRRSSQNDYTQGPPSASPAVKTGTSNQPSSSATPNSTNKSTTSPTIEPSTSKEAQTVDIQDTDKAKVETSSIDKNPSPDKNKPEEENSDIPF